MRYKKFDTWLFSEAMRMANVNNRSFRKISDANSARSNLYLSYYLYFRKEFSSIKSDAVFKINTTAARIEKDDMLKKDYEKALRSWKVSINQNEKKRSLLKKIKNKKSLYKLSTQLDLNYSNAYRFFVKEELSAMKYIDAQKIILLEMKTK